MRTVPFGDTGIQVSAFCLGTMNMGSRVNRDTSERILDAYCAAGGRFVDTANVYTHWDPQGRVGDSEELLGDWIRRRGTRHELFVATKVGLAYPGVPEGLPAATIQRECEHSLRRLGIDTIDLYYGHRDDRTTPLAETLAAFDRLVREGKVRFVGISNTTAWRLAEARDLSRERGWATYSCVQQRFGYLRQNPGPAYAPNASAGFGLLDYCSTYGLPLVGFSPLAKGGLVDAGKLQEQYHSADTEARLAALREAARELGATPNQVALAWIAQHPAPIIPLFSASSVAQAEENLAAADLTLPDEVWSRLNQAGA